MRAVIMKKLLAIETINKEIGAVEARRWLSTERRIVHVYEKFSFLFHHKVDLKKVSR